MERIFEGSVDWEAVGRAEKWLADNGYSLGVMQRNDPRGVLKGDYRISKWRNMTPRHRLELDGTLEGNMRHGPLTLKIKE